MKLEFKAIVRNLAESAHGVTIPQHLLKDKKLKSGQEYKFIVTDHKNLFTRKELKHFLFFLLENELLKEGINYTKIINSFLKNMEEGK
jgi:antitoxin component of MazEF toxin-antitoxin module